MSGQAAADEQEIIRQLEKICASKIFVRSRRLVRLLRYVCERALAGNLHQLKEYTIGVEVFERDASYDPRIDTIVRSEARRLRAKLEAYYEGEGAGDAILIRVPKGSYVPQFEGREATALHSAPSEGVSPRMAISGLAIAASGILIGTVVWYTQRGGQPPAQPVLTRVTSDSGLNVWPALSPDGTLLAFSSDRGGAGDLDIYLQQVGSTAEPLRLTHDPADEHQAHFSPDGRLIAFRSERDGGGVYVMPALGGQARLIADRGLRPRFSPDGQRIAYHVVWPGEIYVTDLEGERHKRVRPDFASAQMPVWSPAGDRLLFEGQPAGDRSTFDWWVSPLDVGPAIRTGVAAALEQNDMFVGWDWASPSIWHASPDVVITSARQGESTNLWQFPISISSGKLRGPLRRIGSGVGHETQPSVSLSGTMAFTGLNSKVDIWAQPIDVARMAAVGSPERLTDSVSEDIHPHVSRDGRTAVFISRRFGNRDVQVMDLSTGQQRALTDNAAAEDRVKISGDGQSVVFSRENGEGRVGLYRMSSGGGSPRRICEDCGYVASVSSDASKVIYSVGRAFESRWYLLNTASGHSTRLFPPGEPIIYSPEFSPDDQWLTFVAWAGQESRRCMVSRLLGDSTEPPEGWLPISQKEDHLATPQWSHDGRSVYFISGTDGFPCVWAQRLDPRSKQPLGKPVAVRHFHRSRFAPHHAAFVGFSVAEDKFILSVQELSGAIWLAQP